MNETEITRQLTIFEELVKHLATKEELVLLRVEMHKMHRQLILWIIGTNLAVGSAIVWWISNQFGQLTFFLQHWKP
jgi:hypothetical protein